jgi:hypothetical protein
VYLGILPVRPLLPLLPLETGVELGDGYHSFLTFMFVFSNLQGCFGLVMMWPAINTVFLRF